MKLTLRRFRIKIDLSRVSNFFTLAFKMDKGKTVLKAMKAEKKICLKITLNRNYYYTHSDSPNIP